MNKTDGVSVFMHEFGHALGMTGFGNADGTLTKGFASVYDSLITFPGRQSLLQRANHGRSVRRTVAAFEFASR